jgi:hypothetical protein
MRLHVLTSVTPKNILFWNETPCSLVQIFRLIGRTTVSGTSVNFYLATRCHIPEYSMLHTCVISTTLNSVPQTTFHRLQAKVLRSWITWRTTDHSDVSNLATSLFMKLSNSSVLMGLEAPHTGASYNLCNKNIVVK